MANAPAASSQTLRMSYRIRRGEQGVLTFEPYKSHLLPLWRFRTAEIARQSSQDLWREFERYGDAGDFVGMDMARKFIQMGMTRAQRYANYKGGRKYEEAGSRDGAGRVAKEKSRGHTGQDEKAAASQVFRAVWSQCREHEVYQKLKEEFQREQKDWDREESKKAKGSPSKETA